MRASGYFEAIQFFITAMGKKETKNVLVNAPEVQEEEEEISYTKELNARTTNVHWRENSLHMRARAYRGQRGKTFCFLKNTYVF
jgi:hypothetical protein